MRRICSTGNAPPTPNGPSLLSNLPSTTSALETPRAVAATLDSLLARETEFPSARLYIGDFYAQSLNWEAALLTYNQGAAHNPKDRAVYNKRAVTALLQMNRPDEARTLIDSVLREFPNDREAHTFDARVLFLTGKSEDLKKCVKELERLVEEDPRDENLRFELGRAYHKNAQLDMAWTEFQRAVRLRSDSVPSLLALAEISQEKNQPDQTVRFANDVLWFAPGDREARLLRCLGLIGTGHYDEAEPALRALLKLYPKDRNARLQLGLLDIWKKNFDEAEALFKSVAIARQPGYSRSGRIGRELRGTKQARQSRRHVAAGNGEPADAARSAEAVGPHRRPRR